MLLIDVELKEQTKELLTDLLKLSNMNSQGSFGHQVTKHLPDLALGTNNIFFTTNKQALSHISMAEIIAQLIRSALYFFSNKLSIDDRSKIMEWILGLGVNQVIEAVLALKTPTTKVFLTHMLVYAAKTGSIEIARKLLTRGIEVNEVIDGCVIRTTALFKAIKGGHLMVSRLLLDAGTDPNSENRRGDRLICVAAKAYRNRVQLVELLIEKGADPNVCGKDGHPLTTAVVYQDLTLVKTLLRAGASVDGHLRTTALQRLASTRTSQRVVSEDRACIAQALLDAGANINAPIGPGLGEVFAFLQIEDDTIIIPEGDFFLLDCLATPIQLAAQEGDMELVHLLIDEGADINACPWEGLQFHIPWEEFWADLVYERTRVSYNHLPLMTALQGGVRNRDVTMLQAMLQQGAHVDERGPSGFTPLQMAGVHGSADIIRLLISYGADINAAAGQEGGLTALQAAVTQGSIEKVQLCLAFGADVNASPSPVRGRTELQAAAETGDSGLLSLFLDAGGEVNAEAALKGGRTCLQAAVEKRQLQMVQILLVHGADVNAPASSLSGGLTALQAALVNIRPFAKACPAEQEELPELAILRAILKAGPDVNAPASPENGIRALEAAIQGGRVDIVHTLLHMGANPNSRPGSTPGIIRAVSVNSIEMVALMISSGADLEVRSHDTIYPSEYFRYNFVRTALHKAIEDRNLPMTTFLLDSGARLSPSFYSNEWTPLQAAAALGYLDLVKLLLARHADPNTDNEESSLQLLLQDYHNAWRSDIVGTVSALIAAHAKVNTHVGSSPLRLAAKKGFIEVVRELIAAGAEVNFVDDYGQTALRESIIWQLTLIAKELIQAGADVDLLAGFGGYRQTALQAAAVRGNLELVQLLLDRGANVNAPATGEGGKTALQAAVESGFLKISIVLLEAGAQVDAPSVPDRFCKGRNALEFAAENGRLDCAHLLLSNYPDNGEIAKVCENAAKLAESEGHMVLATSVRQHGLQKC